MGKPANLREYVPTCAEARPASSRTVPGCCRQSADSSDRRRRIASCAAMAPDHEKSHMDIRPNRVYFFRKSGNRVATVEPTNYGGRGNWVVRRVDGVSVGKEMIVPGRALVTCVD